jgi:hypothetical protein
MDRLAAAPRGERDALEEMGLAEAAESLDRRRDLDLADLAASLKPSKAGQPHMRIKPEPGALSSVDPMPRRSQSVFNNVCAGAIRGYAKDAANNGREKTMTTIFFTACQLILLDVLPKGSKFNQQYFVDYVFPGLKTGNRDCRRRMPLATLWEYMDNSICHNV